MLSKLRQIFCYCRYFMTLLCIKNSFPYEPILWLSFSYYSHETCFCYVSETWRDERKSRRMETTQRENNQCAKVFLSARMLQSCYGGLILKPYWFPCCLKIEFLERNGSYQSATCINPYTGTNNQFNNQLQKFSNYPE